ncbi:phage neck terminator protein [Serratia quinivorans]|uniref:phage neck terminator protein n=1 Tax=Serratia quinivorans TaxID=137545 RepID=UPI003F5F6FC6
MSNDSTTPGYLTPTGSGPAYDEELERLLSRWIRGLTGLDKNVVYPRWTDPQIQIPKNGTTWCAFGITGVQEDANPAYIQGDESSEQWSHETVDILCCFYGPRGMSVVTQFRDGLFVSQNNDELKAIGLTLLDCGRIFNLPELINNQWVRRYDIAVRLRRKVVREYGIKSLVEAPVQFFGE